MNKKIIDTLSKSWSLSNINAGDTILLHSDLRRLIYRYRKIKIRLDLGDIIESFIDLIGSKGTLILPMFNFEFLKGVKFNINKTKSQSGALSEFFRTNYKVVRTGHPVYSFGIFGYNQDKFRDLDNYSGYAENSPFGIIKNINGKIAILDLEDSKSMTFYHHIEELNNVDWRYFKIFEGKYVDIKGIEKKKKYSIFVRNLENQVITHVNPAGELLWKNNLYKGSRPLIDNGLRSINAKAMFDFISLLIKNNQARNILYKSK